MRIEPVVIAVVLLAQIASVGVVWAGEDCGDEAQFAEIGLDQFWADVVANEPVIEAGAAEIRAAQADVVAEEQTWLPDFGVEAQGDVGQRNSPGEERALGISARGSVVGSTSWDLLDSRRQWARQTAQATVEEQRQAAQSIDYEVRAEAARLYVMAGLADERLQILDELGEHLEEFEAFLEQRQQAGVESAYEQAIIDEARAKWERERSEARSIRRAAVQELSFWAGYCVETDGIEISTPDDLNEEITANLPAARHLRAQARTAEVSAKEIAADGAWQAGPMGAVGIYFSPVHDNFIHPEYYVGGFARWNPDLFGVRQNRAQAQEQRAQALDARAQSLERAAAAELEQFHQWRRRAEEQQQAFETERQNIEDVLARATLRWREGVGPWREVLDARERLEEARLDELEFRLEYAQSLVDIAIATGALDELPQWLGQ